MKSSQGQDSRAGDIILVKHADPVIVPEDPPSSWSLSRDGLLRSEELARRLAQYDPSRIVCSEEPKAIQTADVVGSRLRRPVSVESDLRENDRSGVPFYRIQSDFNERIRAFFQRASAVELGQESADQAHSRFVAAVRRIPASGSGRPIVVISHGAVISLLVARANELDVFSFWSEFGFASFAVVTAAAFTLKEVVHIASPSSGSSS